MKIIIGDFDLLKEKSYSVRDKVFIEEQHVSEEIEHDAFDKDSIHFVIEHENKPIGVARIQQDGHIGRVCVLKEWRGKGIGMALLQQTVLKAKTMGLKGVYLNAQIQAIKFYEQFGFRVTSDSFYEANIEHKTMYRETSLPFCELVFEIDVNNNVQRIVKRSTMRKLELPHRSSYIVVANSDNKFLIEVRTLCKDYCPGKLDCCVGGVQQIFEDKFESASRELFEEVGIRAKEDSLVFLGTQKIVSAPTFVMADLYFIQGNFITRRQESEVSGVLFLDDKDILRLEDNIAKDSLKAYRYILDKAKDKGLI